MSRGASKGSWLEQVQLSTPLTISLAVLVQKTTPRQPVIPAVTLSPSCLPDGCLIIEIACRALRRPFPQSIPVPTLSRLIDASVPITRGVQQRVVSMTHDLLAYSIKTVKIMLKGPCRRISRGENGDEVLANVLLHMSVNWGFTRLVVFLAILVTQGW